MHLCIKCDSSNVVKNGFVRGLQRRKCKACGYNFTKGRGHDMRTRMQALMLYRENVSMRGIGRLLDVSNVTVMNWIKEAGMSVKDALERRFIEAGHDLDIIELDEMWHYTQKNSENFGYGLLCIVPQDESLPLKLALVAPKRLRDCLQN